MMETDDKLIRDFFATEKQELPDDGFSRRVMHNLPNRKNRLAKLWSLFVTIVALTLFFVFNGLQAIIDTLREVFVSMVQNGTAASFDPKTIIIAVIVLAFLGVRKAWSMT